MAATPAMHPAAAPEPQAGGGGAAAPVQQGGAGVFVRFEPCGCHVAVENFREAVLHALAHGGGLRMLNTRGVTFSTMI